MLVLVDRKHEMGPTEWLRRFNPTYTRWSRPREVAAREAIKDLLAIEDQKVAMALARRRFATVLTASSHDAQGAR